MTDEEKLYLDSCRLYYKEDAPILSDYDFDQLQLKLANNWPATSEEFKRRAIPQEYDPEWTNVYNAMKTQGHVADWNY